MNASVMLSQNNEYRSADRRYFSRRCREGRAETRVDVTVVLVVKLPRFLTDGDPSALHPISFGSTPMSYLTFVPVALSPSLGATQVTGNIIFEASFEGTSQNYSTALPGFGS
jgi:hypothetical protein